MVPASLPECHETARIRPDGRPTAVVVAGELGVGKTRLVREFLAQADVEAAITSSREVRDPAAAAGPFDTRAWALVDDALAKFRAHYYAAAPQEVSLAQQSLHAAVDEVRQMGNAFVIEGRAAPTKSSTPRRICDSMVSGLVNRPTLTTGLPVTLARLRDLAESGSTAG